MQNSFARYLSFTLLFIFLAACTSCASRTAYRINTEGADDAHVTGTYTLVLYGCTYSDDLDTFAILDREGDKYVLDPYAPNFNYKIKTGLSAKDAMEQAEQFINCHSSYNGSQLIKLRSSKGVFIGYTLKPKYLSTTLVIDEVLDSEAEIYSFRKKSAKKTQR
ncbi:MAG: hypothetical protein HZA17_03170 [Nitrospirae bacterium]|nr:hypothetical protein [Nitrospirota bacterium]